MADYNEMVIKRQPWKRGLRSLFSSGAAERSLLNQGQIPIGAPGMGAPVSREESFARQGIRPQSFTVGDPRERVLRNQGFQQRAEQRGVGGMMRQTIEFENWRRKMGDILHTYPLVGRLFGR
jgi:hypothetical protein